MGIIGVLVIVVGLLISVALHECGHMIPAKKFGVYVPEFAVGFGPQIFGRDVRTGSRWGENDESTRKADPCPRGS